MTKIALVADTHFGCRSDSAVLFEHQEKFVSQIFFPTLLDQGIDTIIHLGDLVDRRHHISFNTLRKMNETFIKPIINNNMTMHITVGNHDTFFKNTNDINALRELYSHSQYNKNIHFYEGATDVNIKGTNILMVPWICPENYDNSIEKIHNSTSKYAMGHLEVEGMEMMRGMKCEHGLSHNTFSKFHSVFSGHFHHRNSRNNIDYIGAAFEFYWSDVNGDRGFVILDLETGKTDFIKNPFNVFEVVRYNSDVGFERTPEKYVDKYVKLIVEKSDDQLILDGVVDFIDRLAYNVQVQDLTDVIVESNNDVTQANSTYDIIIEHTKNVSSDDFDNKDLVDLMSDVYKEAYL